MGNRGCMTDAPQDRRSDGPPEAGGAAGATVDPAEVARFAALAGEWWDARGRFAPLHRMNPARLRLIRDAICRNFGRDPAGARPFDGLHIVDLGCGGGLICEPMARLGATVTGIDAGAEAVEIARAHARQSGLAIDYRHDTAEALAEAGEAFDVVLNLEVVEHVLDVAVFMAAAGGLVKPGGLQIVATLNRTLRSMALGVVAAEYILRWVPPGTHDWRKFLRPSEIAVHLRAAGLTVERTAGLIYNPLTDSWQESGDLGVNYMMVAQRAA